MRYEKLTLAQMTCWTGFFLLMTIYAILNRVDSWSLITMLIMKYFSMECSYPTQNLLANTM